MSLFWRDAFQVFFFMHSSPLSLPPSGSPVSQCFSLVGLILRNLSLSFYRFFQREMFWSKPETSTSLLPELWWNECRILLDRYLLQIWLNSVKPKLSYELKVSYISPCLWRWKMLCDTPRACLERFILINCCYQISAMDCGWHTLDGWRSTQTRLLTCRSQRD